MPINKHFRAITVTHNHLDPFPSMFFPFRSSSRMASFSQVLAQSLGSSTFKIPYFFLSQVAATVTVAEVVLCPKVIKVFATFQAISRPLDAMQQNKSSGLCMGNTHFLTRNSHGDVGTLSCVICLPLIHFCF